MQAQIFSIHTGKAIPTESQLDRLAMLHESHPETRVVYSPHCPCGKCTPRSRDEVWKELYPLRMTGAEDKEKRDALVKELLQIPNVFFMEY